MKVRLALFLVGGLVMALGLYGIVRDATMTHPVNWAVFFLGGIAAHDLLLAPVVLTVAAVGLRWAGPLVRAGLIVSGLVTLTMLPVMLRLGDRQRDPSRLPLPYGRNLLIVLGLVWAGIGVLAVVRHQRRALRSPSGR